MRKKGSGFPLSDGAETTRCFYRVRAYGILCMKGGTDDGN